MSCVTSRRLDAAVDDDSLDAGLLQPPHQFAHVLRCARHRNLTDDEIVADDVPMASEATRREASRSDSIRAVHASHDDGMACRLQSCAPRMAAASRRTSSSASRARWTALISLPAWRTAGGVSPLCARRGCRARRLPGEWPSPPACPGRAARPPLRLPERGGAKRGPPFSAVENHAQRSERILVRREGAQRFDNLRVHGYEVATRGPCD